jgi:hypothetical protein
MIHIEDMESKHLDILISEYNWDNEFRVPQMIVDNKNCELATSLKTFYLSDGYSYLQQSKHQNIMWHQFVSCLYNRILLGDFSEGSLSYKIPLTKTQIYKLRKGNIPEVFLTDI